MLTRLIDRGFHVAYRIAWPIVSRYRRYSRNDGVSIAVWVNHRILVVRHSYKPGLGIPGGGVNRGEKPAVGAARELWEEVGIQVDPAALRLIQTKRYTSGSSNYFYEIDLAAQPLITIDRREIVYAAFLPQVEVMLSGCDKYFAAYMTNYTTPMRVLEVADS